MHSVSSYADLVTDLDAESVNENEADTKVVPEKGEVNPIPKGSEERPLKKPQKPRVDSNSNAASHSPVRYKSEGMSAFPEKGYFELKKDVEVWQEDLRITSKHALVYFDSITREVDRVVAEGEVVIIKTDTLTQQKIKANAEKAVFESKRQRITLLGNAKFSRGVDHFKGDRIEYDMSTGWIKASKVKGAITP